jgi:putative ABC transport system permease protein
MDLEKTFAISLNALKTNKLRSLLTSLGIIIGISSVIMLLSIGSGLKKYITQQFESLGTNQLLIVPGEVGGESGFSGNPQAYTSFKFIPEDIRNIQRKVSNIVGAVPGIESADTLEYRGESKVVQVIGSTAQYKDIVTTKLETGRFFTNSETKDAKKVAVIGNQVVEDFFQGRNPIGKKITLGSFKFEVIGVAEKRGRSGLGSQVDLIAYIPVTTAENLLDLDKFSWIAVKAQNKEDIPKIRKQLELVIGERLDEDDFSVVETEQLLSSVNNILSVLSAGLGGIAAISLLVGGIGIMNIMFVSVTERTKEIGLRKAVGAKPIDIRIQFLIEAVILSISGGIIALLIAWGGTTILNRFFPAHITWWSIILAFSISTLVGIIFGVAPAYKASKLDPIDALRYE